VLPRPGPAPLGAVPQSGSEALAAARAMQERVRLLRRISAEHLRHLARPFWLAGWRPADVLHAIDHEPGGRQHGILSVIDSPPYRRGIKGMRNLQEGRHALAEKIFHGRRRELFQRYREGMEDQLGALGIVLNCVVLWNTVYIDAALNQLRVQGYPVRDEDVARLSPFMRNHVNVHGKYSFTAIVPADPGKGASATRQLRDPDVRDEDEDDFDEDDSW